MKQLSQPVLGENVAQVGIKLDVLSTRAVISKNNTQKEQKTKIYNSSESESTQKTKGWQLSVEIGQTGQYIDLICLPHFTVLPVALQLIVPWTQMKEKEKGWMREYLL